MCMGQEGGGLTKKDAKRSCSVHVDVGPPFAQTQLQDCGNTVGPYRITEYICEELST